MTGNPVAPDDGSASGIEEDDAERESVRDTVEEADAVVSVDDEGTVVFANDAVESIFGYAPAELMDEPLSRFVVDDIDEFPTDGATELTGTHHDGHEIPLSVSFHEHEIDGQRLYTGIVRNVSAGTAQLDRATRLNQVLRAVNQVLVEASTREELEREICERLTVDGLYELAWVGEHGMASNQISPRTSAGDGEDYLEEITVMADDSAEGQGPAGRAARTREAQLCRDIESDPDFAPWREAALDYGFRSSVAVPLAHEDTFYGVLGLYADSPDAFHEEELDVLEELGTVIASGITAVERKRTLLADTLTELEFEVNSASALFFDGCGQDGWQLELRELVPSAGDALLAYVEVTGATPEDVVERALADDAVAEARVVSSHRDSGLIEFGTTGETVIRQVTDAGANVRSAIVDDGTGRFIAEVATEADIRTLVDAITDVAPDATLVAKREVERSTETAPEFRQDLSEELTDRQHTVLEAAYQGGYFNWPRDSSGEDLADSLGIASSTFSQHLRAAERKLLSTFFDDTDRE